MKLASDQMKQVQSPPHNNYSDKIMITKSRAQEALLMHVQINITVNPL